MGPALGTTMQNLIFYDYCRTFICFSTFYHHSLRVVFLPTVGGTLQKNGGGSSLNAPAYARQYFVSSIVSTAAIAQTGSPVSVNERG